MFQPNILLVPSAFLIQLHAGSRCLLQLWSGGLAYMVVVDPLLLTSPKEKANADFPMVHPSSRGVWYRQGNWISPAVKGGGGGGEGPNRPAAAA